MKKSELKLLLSLALENLKAAQDNHDIVIAARSDLNSTLAERDSLRLERSKLQEAYSTAKSKLLALGCALDVDGVTWIDPIPMPQPAIVWSARPARPAGDDWRDPRVPSAPFTGDEQLEWIDMAGNHHLDHHCDIISWNNVAWFRQVVAKSDAPEILYPAHPGQGWVKNTGDGPLPSNNKLVDVVLFDGSTIEGRDAYSLMWGISDPVDDPASFGSSIAFWRDAK